MFWSFPWKVCYEKENFYHTEFQNGGYTQVFDWKKIINKLSEQFSKKNSKSKNKTCLILSVGTLRSQRKTEMTWRETEWF